MIEFHYLETKTHLPACGAPTSRHANKNVESVPLCKKCLKIIRERA